MLKNGIVLEKVMKTYPTLRMSIQVFFKNSSRTLQLPEPKMWGKRDKWGQHITCTMQKNHMLIQNRNYSKKGHLFKNMQIYFGNTICTFKNQYKSIRTYYLSQDYVHHKVNNIKSSQVIMHINIIEHIINITLSSSYNIKKRA